MNEKVNIALINLGCSKNLVDSELILGILSKEGYNVSLEYEYSDLVIINTCSFINDAEKESVKTIMNMVQSGKKIIIAGCLAQKYGEELIKLIPESSAIVGTSDIEQIPNIVKNILKDDTKHFTQVSSNITYLQNENSNRLHITMGPYSYIKISEGCDWNCTYCVIPQLKGRYRSRNIQSIVNEAKEMSYKGIKEIILIAQDTTNYGYDLYKKPMLSELLLELNNIKDIEWIRLMYTYPKNINDQLIEVINSSSKIVKYLDIPLQHSHPEILSKMNRPKVDMENLILKLRQKIPGIAIRTSFIVGFPGETEEHFEHLCNFVKKHKFERLGVFEYSKETMTPSAKFKGHVKANIKKQRKKTLMQIQKTISNANQKNYLGKTINVLIENLNNSNSATGRSCMDAPEIDGIVYIKDVTGNLPGDIIPVKIEKVSAYDFYGVAKS